MKLKDIEFLLIDCQTTGMRPPNGRIVELAWSIASAEQSECVVHSHLVALPEGESIPRKVQELTGICDEDMRTAESMAIVFDQFHRDICSRPAPLTALIHYAQFERPYLKHLYLEHQQSEELPFEIICSHGLLKRLMPTLPSLNIRAAAGYFGNPVAGIKRAGSHVMATHQIWRGLVEELARNGIVDLEAVRLKMGAKPPASQKRYDYRLDRLKRLKLPDSPGVYRMLAKSGDVLYVGKATSLKSRVNSYFRGYSGRDRRKLEMLAQVWDLDVTSCRSALEAALLETDEIKRLNPPYNVVMKRGRRHLLFYNHDFSSSSRVRDADHRIGPFRNSNWIEHLRLLAQSLEQGLFEQIFFVPLREELLREGFALFLRIHGLAEGPWSVRRLLAYGLQLHRRYEEPENVPEEEVEEEQPESAVELEPSTDEIAGKFERLLRRAGHEYARSKLMNRLLDSQVRVCIHGEWRVLNFQGGVLNSNLNFDLTFESGATRRPLHSRTILDLETFDRMSVLLSELDKHEHQILL